MDTNQTYPYAIPYGGNGTNPPSPPIQNPQQQMPMPQQNQYYNQQNQYPSTYPSNPPKRLTEEESYIENIVRANKGKMATFYMSYGDSNEWRDRTYKGIIEAAGVDHIIISDPKDGKRYILLNVYLDWIEFGDEINYIYPYR
jgi:spore germination protein Q